MHTNEMGKVRIREMPRTRKTNEMHLATTSSTTTKSKSEHFKGLHHLLFQESHKLPSLPHTIHLMLLCSTLGIFASIFSQILQNDSSVKLTFDQTNMTTTIESTTTLNFILDGTECPSPNPSEDGGQSDASLELELPDLDPLTESSIPIPIEHNDMDESTSVLLSGEPVGNETLVQQIEQFEGGEEDVTESDYELLKRVTTNVGDYEPLDHERPERFIPVLEARGNNDNDKDEDGHRRDTLPIADAIDQHKGGVKSHSAVFQFLEDNEGDNRVAVKSNIALKNFLQIQAQGIIVRNNPGTLSATSQKKFDDMLRELSDAGLMIMTHPDVMSTLGAKDVSSVLDDNPLHRINDRSAALTLFSSNSTH